MPHWMGYVFMGIPLSVLLGVIITAMIADEDARKIIFAIGLLISMIVMFTYGLSMIVK